LQEESLRSKPKVLANIEELERLQPLLREARNEDEAAIKIAARTQALSEAQAAAEEASASRIAELEAVGTHPLLRNANLAYSMPLKEREYTCSVCCS
jgi:dihydropteroate synthase